MTDQSLRQIGPAGLNPLLYGLPGDVLDNVSSVLQFVARVHEDLADGHFQSEHHDGPQPDAMTASEHRGLVLVLRVADAAVRYVADGRLPNGGQS